MIELLAKIPGEHAIEHATGVYIGLLLLACVVGIVSKWVAHLPYTIALTLVGLAIAVFRLGPDVEELGFGRELILFVMLPPLLFQGALHMDLERLLAHIWPIMTFAIVGVVASTLIIGGVMHWFGGVEVVLVAMLFGALITPTDPVSVLALFRECKVPDDLKYLVEGESLFNDGTGIVVFTILLGMLIDGRPFNPGEAGLEFIKVGAGGLLLGAALGGIAYLLLHHLHDHLLENAICLVLAFGSFWVAEVVHCSGVIATVTAGLLIGNFGRRFTLHRQARETVETFFESLDFLINSLLFILIGLELQVVEWVAVKTNARAIVAGIVGMLAARALVVYTLYYLLNRAGTRRPPGWAHVMFWGGLRGSIPIALLLGLPDNAALAPYRTMLLVAGFAAVLFSLVFQGVTMKPLLNWLQISATSGTDGTPPDLPPPTTAPHPETLA